MLPQGNRSYRSRVTGNTALACLTSVRPGQSLDVLFEARAPLSHHRQEFESVVEAAPVPQYRPYVPWLVERGQAKVQRNHFPDRNLSRQQHANACFRQILTVRVQSLVLVPGQQSNRDTELRAVAWISPAAPICCRRGGLSGLGGHTYSWLCSRWRGLETYTITKT